MKKLLALLLAIVLTLSLASCASLQKQIEDAVNGAAESVSGAVTEAPKAASSDRDLEVAKHNAYIDLFNCLIDDIDKVVYDYVDKFGYEDAIAIPENFSGFSMYSNSVIRYLDEAVPYATKQPEELQADAALLLLEPDLREYAQALTDAKIYYGEKNYVDDNFGKSQYYHDIIVGKYYDMWDKIDVFLEAVDVMLEGADDKALAEYQAEGSMVHYWALKTLVDSQSMTRYLNENEFYDDNALEINLDEFRPIYDAFVASYNEYNTVIGDAVDGKSGADYVEDIFTSSISQYTDQLKKVKSCAASLVEHLQNQSDFSTAEMSLGDGTPEGLRKEVGSLLSKYNTWIV